MMVRRILGICVQLMLGIFALLLLVAMIARTNSLTQKAISAGFFLGTVWLMMTLHKRAKVKQRPDEIRKSQSDAS